MITKLSQTTAESASHPRLALLLGNLMPLAGVLLFNWSVFPILALYWAENVIIGVINVLKILTCQGAVTTTQKFGQGRKMPAEFVSNLSSAAADINASGSSSPTTRAGIALFFAVHYGIFTTVHGVFVMVLGQFAGENSSSYYGNWKELNPWIVGLTLLGLAASQIYIFVTDYLIAGMGREKSPSDIMFLPYPRMLVLHVTIIFGAFASMTLGSPKAIVAILVALKTALDLVLDARRSA